jgi:hypothetical protein
MKLSRAILGFIFIALSLPVIAFVVIVSWATGGDLDFFKEDCE